MAEQQFKRNIAFQKEILSHNSKLPLGVVKLNSLDLNILHILRNKARIPLYQLAKTLRCSVITAKEHIISLITKGVIKKFTISVNYKKIGFQKALIFLSVLTDQTKQDNLIRYIERKFLSINHIVGYLDYWNISIQLYFKEYKEVDFFIEDLLQKFQDCILDYNKLIVLEEVKFEAYNPNIKEIYHKALNLLRLK